MLGHSKLFSPEQKIVNEQKINIMNKSKIEIGQPEQEPINEQKAELLPSAQVSANALVMRRCPFCDDEPILIKRGNSFTKKRSAEIECTNCHAKLIVGAIRNNLEWCEEKVIEKWNKRLFKNEVLPPNLKRFSTALVWYHRLEEMPHEGNRIIVYSPCYDDKYAMKLRIIDSQFYGISKDAEWWAYVNCPNGA